MRYIGNCPQNPPAEDKPLVLNQTIDYGSAIIEVVNNCMEQQQPDRFYSTKKHGDYTCRGQNRQIKIRTCAA